MKGKTKMKKNEFDLFDGLELTNDEKKELELSDQISKMIIKMTEKRIALGMSQRDLANVSGIKQPMIARIEKFDVVPRLDTIIKIANCLDLTFDIENKVPVNVSIEINVEFSQKKFAFNNSITNNKFQMTC